MSLGGFGRAGVKACDLLDWRKICQCGVQAVGTYAAHGGLGGPFEGAQDQDPSRFAGAQVGRGDPGHFSLQSPNTPGPTSILLIPTMNGPP